MSKKTDELFAILESKNDFYEYVKENAEEFTDKTLSELLNDFCDASGLEKSEIIKYSNLDKTYAYQMFSGMKKNPSRNKLLMLCFGMKLNVKKVQTLLKKAGYPTLYPRIKRDSALIFSLEQKLTLIEANELLYELGEEILE